MYTLNFILYIMSNNLKAVLFLLLIDFVFIDYHAYRRLRITFRTTQTARNFTRLILLSGQYCAAVS